MWVPPDPIIFLLGFPVKLRTIVIAMIGVVFSLIFTMFKWPQFWRNFYKQNAERKEAHKQNNVPVLAWVVLTLAIFILGAAIGSVVTFKNAMNSIPENVLVQKCAEYSTGCVPIECNSIMSDSNPYLVCSTCGEGLSQVIRIEVPVVKSPV